MPNSLRDVLEPNCPNIVDRLEALAECRKRGIHAESLLLQPTFPSSVKSASSLGSFMDILQQFGVRNVKPEFLTVDPLNLGIIAQFVHHFEGLDAVKELLHNYVRKENEDHRKQRFRMAPNRQLSADLMLRLDAAATQRGITVTLCNWVKRELSKVDPAVKSIASQAAKEGYVCLGYYWKLFSTGST